jgi:hypothetical protein
MSAAVMMSADNRPLRPVNLQAEMEMIANLKRMWGAAAGEDVDVRIVGSRVVAFASELGVLRIASEWATLARNRYPETREAGVLGWSYSMDHLLRMEPA